eukprot:722176-Lingulodinium_polyedra.AAC.1
MARTRVAHSAALKRRNARVTVSSRNVSLNAAQQCGQTRASQLQRGKMRYARTHHARTLTWCAH